MTAPSSTSLRRRDAEARAAAQREFTRPVVLEAGAGTGKTSVLVARIAVWALGPGWERTEERLGCDPPDPDRVAAEVLGRTAAITFTEAAAAEMARRAGEVLAHLEREPKMTAVDRIEGAAEDADACHSGLGACPRCRHWRT